MESQLSKQFIEVTSRNAPMIFRLARLVTLRCALCQRRTCGRHQTCQCIATCGGAGGGPPSLPPPRRWGCPAWLASQARCSHARCAKSERCCRLSNQARHSVVPDAAAVRRWRWSQVSHIMPVCSVLCERMVFGTQSVRIELSARPPTHLVPNLLYASICIRGRSVGPSPSLQQPANLLIFSQEPSCSNWEDRDRRVVSGGSRGPRRSRGGWSRCCSSTCPGSGCCRRWGPWWASRRLRRWHASPSAAGTPPPSPPGGHPGGDAPPAWGPAVCMATGVRQEPE